MSATTAPASQSLIQRLAGIDLRSLAAFRIGLGLILLWDLVTSLSGAGALYSESGTMPVAVAEQLRESPWIVSLHSLSGATAWQVALITLQIVAAVCLLVGWRTQRAVAVSWVLLCSLQARNPVVLHGGDTVLRMLLFWSLFLPLGARWSADAAQGRRSCFAEEGRVFVVASLAMLFQTAMIYWFTAALKWGNEWTRDGTAIYYALSVDQFVKTPGLWLLQFPRICHGLTFGVWWLEILGPFAAFIPWRTSWWRMAVVGAFWALHIGFAMCMRLGPFPMTMMVAWLPFVPAEFWDWMGRRSRRGAGASEPGSMHRWMQHGVVQAFALVCLFYVLLWNLRTTNRERWEGLFPMSLNPFGFALRLDQYWALFAPKPLTEDGWLVLEATQKDGTKIDLIREGREVSYEKPALISAEFRDYKWQKLEMNLYLAQNAMVRAPFCSHLVARWNENQLPERQIVSWTLNYMRELTLPHHFAVKPQRVELWRSDGK
jgi:hypothetical protein